MKRLSSLVLSLAVISSVLCFPACQGEEIKAVRLAYGTGETSSIAYNSDLYYRNDSQVNSCDPHVIYVSEEDDEEYGGWYYLYGSSEYTGGYEGNPNTLLAFDCFRSKTLTNWERVGAANGYALVSAPDDWTYNQLWAPEVIHDKETGKYYMYYSACRIQPEWGTSRVMSEARSRTTGASLDACLAVASSDSPMGPFKLIREGVDANGNEIKNEPTFDFVEAFELENPWSVIDASIFNDDGTLYLYFNKAAEDNTIASSLGVWGMKLKDYVTADFSTVRCLTAPGYKSVNYETGKLVAESDYLEEGTVIGDADLLATDVTRNEAPFMYKHNGKYYLTFSPAGFKDAGYCVMQAVSDSPLGIFVKPNISQGNPVVGTAASQMTYISATGHHCLINVDGQLYSVYARAGNPSIFNDAGMRFIGTDKCGFAKFGDMEEEVLYCNGPTISPQPLPEKLSGYKNVAAQAKVTVSKGDGVGKLNDEKLGAMSTLLDEEFKANGQVKITLTFEESVDVRAIMVYNSSSYETAFSAIDSVRLYFAENETYDCGIIENLSFPAKYVMGSDHSIVLGAAAIADFNEIKVNKIEFNISKKYVMQDRYGKTNHSIGITEIVVLGK